MQTQSATKLIACFLNTNFIIRNHSFAILSDYLKNFDYDSDFESLIIVLFYQRINFFSPSAWNHHLLTSKITDLSEKKKII